MAKISVHGGPTDQNQPGYFELGQSYMSPEVTETDVQPNEEVLVSDEEPVDEEDLEPEYESDSETTPPPTNLNSNIP